jgi:hypothetical protein
VFRHILIIIVSLFSKKSPWRWPHKWPKHVGDYIKIKLHLNKLKYVCWSVMYRIHSYLLLSGQFLKFLRGVGECSWLLEKYSISMDIFWRFGDTTTFWSVWNYLLVDIAWYPRIFVSSTFSKKLRPVNDWQTHASNDIRTYYSHKSIKVTSVYLRLNI